MSSGGSGSRFKGDSRERLLAAVTYLSNNFGYGQIRIANLTREAAVSRQTFYRLFDGKEDLFMAAYEQAAHEILGRLQQSFDSSEWWEIPAQGMRVLLEQMEADPEAARLFFIASMAAGSRVRRQRNEVLSVFEQLTSDFLDRAPEDGLTLDVPPVALVGAIRSLASSQLRADAADRLPHLADDLVVWMRSYSAPASRPRWSTGPNVLLAPSEFSDGARAPTPLLHRPEQLPFGRRQSSAAAVARNHRERILHATAQVALEKGYVEMTVKDIVAAAVIGKDVFYQHFTNKQEAFLAAEQHATKEMVAEVARAFFDPPTWPERIYNGLRVLTIVIAKEPLFAHLRLVEAYAAGPPAIRLMDEVTASFTVFLEEGYKQRPEAEALPALCSSAITGAVFELIRRDVSHKKAAELPRRVPQLAYVAIAPFLGAEAAVEVIEEISARESASSV
jgi:AcrR family transcriptional regulator